MEESAFEAAVKEHAGEQGARTIHDLISTKSRQRERAAAAAAATSRTSRASGSRRFSRRRNAAGGGGGGGTAAKGGDVSAREESVIVEIGGSAARGCDGTTPVEWKTSADGSADGGAASGLVPNDGATMASMGWPPVLPTLTEEEKEEEKKPAGELMDALSARIDPGFPVSH